MSVKKRFLRRGLLAIIALFPLIAIAATTPLALDHLAQELGWTMSPDNICGGYYVDQPFTFISPVEKNNAIEITSNHGLIAEHGTSTLEGNVTLTRQGQQITANQAYAYRDPTTFKLTAMELVGDVRLREPDTLIIGKQGRYNFETKAKSLLNILYRTALANKSSVKPPLKTKDLQKVRNVTSLTAWGKADEFSQAEPRIYHLYSASYSTCPPLHMTWQMKASHIVLNKNTGRGYATHARILVKNVPVFYAPYINFPIDKQRKSGLLWPTFGASNSYGPYIFLPFYWNMAPNHDMTLTPALLSKRGMQLSDHFRYLTETSLGEMNISVLPNDKFFEQFQKDTKTNPQYATSTNAVTQAELSRLLNDSPTRTAFFWRDQSQFNEHWSSHVDFNAVSDDYYVRDFGNFNDSMQNQLLQEADLNYKDQHWNFTGRVQTYQTLHPIDEDPVVNQYRRAPQLILNGDYPDEPGGLDYFINNELTHFDIRNTPGTQANQPIGNRLHIQPGISLPLSLPYFYVTPRVQLALTQYQLYETADTDTPNTKRRALPIVDIDSGLFFDRHATLFSTAYQQTLEPRVYYAYVPFRSQSSIPVFDTTLNTLTYDQIFNYNRFSGIDRIGDTHQLSTGITTRLINPESGLEKMRLGVGEIFYFADRYVTLCSNFTCGKVFNPSNGWSVSPITGVLDYHLDEQWQLSVNSIWNPITKQMDNSTLNVHYQPDPLRIINLSYGYVHNTDSVSDSLNSTSQDNLKVTDISFAWPLFPTISLVGRWSEDWNQVHLQNLLSGLQYDTCCWAVRLVGGRALTHLDANDNYKPVYSNEIYLQFSLKGLGDVGSDPSKLLSSISGYNTQQFGRDL